MCEVETEWVTCSSGVYHDMKKRLDNKGIIELHSCWADWTDTDTPKFMTTWGDKDTPLIKIEGIINGKCQHWLNVNYTKPL